MSDRESEEKIGRVPDIGDMVTEIRRKSPQEARDLLYKWIQAAETKGHHEGLDEGLKRGREGVTRTTLAALGAPPAPPSVEAAPAERCHCGHEAAKCLACDCPQCSVVAPRPVDAEVARLRSALAASEQARAQAEERHRAHVKDLVETGAALSKRATDAERTLAAEQRRGSEACMDWAAKRDAALARAEQAERQVEDLQRALIRQTSEALDESRSASEARGELGEARAAVIEEIARWLEGQNHSGFRGDATYLVQDIAEKLRARAVAQKEDDHGSR